MANNGNSIATPFLQNAIELNRLTFKYTYPFPLKIKIFKRVLTVKVDHVLKLKYIPFLFASICIIFISGFGSCTFLLFMNQLHKVTTVDVTSFVIFIYFGAFSFAQTATYYVYWKAPEIEFVTNQLLSIERKCKWSKFVF